MLAAWWFVVFALLAAVPRHASAQGGTASREVVALVARYDSAWNRRDTATAGGLMAARYQYFTSRGDVRPREAMIAFLADPDYRLVAADRSEIAVTVSGPVAVVSSRWRGHGTWRDEAFTDDQRCGLVWQQTAGSWRLLSEHCIQIAPRPPAAETD
jgi:hypothetical protein